ncbi:MAG: RecQ family ATP-dependent DNA helicase [Oscillospiraceae bacterium]|nr:RecQ family ATP-dependent DNA helicase [Oscillospiraceae bacterium]
MAEYDLYRRAEAVLKRMYGEKASFREGQFEAIEATMNNRRSLIVQKTGWGKSLVYFICCTLLKEDNKGATIVVSPLLALMDNQVEAAERAGIRCDCLNSTKRSRERRTAILEELENGELDLVLVTPEGVFKDDFQQTLANTVVGLFVIDEAHCISDWGHDFRLEYGRLNQVISALPSNVRLLGTTATANDRVVEDLKKQFGNNVYVSRGPLLRDNLYIQVLQMPDRASRYAWMVENIPKLEGTGIVYCLTSRDCDYIASYLKKYGISAETYYSDMGDKADESLVKFQSNEIKVLVATIKLGMGYDKGDVSFIIHYQMPQNIVSYYQQIGRAGRNVEKAYTFLMMGQEDQNIIEYFIRTAFPTEKELIEVRKTVTEHSGIKANRMSQYINALKTRVDKALNFLEHEGYIRYDNGYYSTPKQFVYQREYYEQIKTIRYHEMRQMQELQDLKSCYNRFIINALDDNTVGDCGFCAYCSGEQFSGDVQLNDLKEAQKYLESLQMKIDPRKRWPKIDGFSHSNKNIQFKNDEGICLCKYGDPGYGMLVKEGKYPPLLQKPHFSDRLVAKSARILKPVIEEKEIKYVTGVPSLNSDIVQDFAQRLDLRLGLQYVPVLGKIKASPQKRMENSSFQCSNALESFYVLEGAVIPDRVLLVDDIVDSKWTLTVCGYLIMSEGCEEVFPYALADSSQKED